MVEKIQGLIDKIKTEGVKAAEEQAQHIENEAHAKAGAIIAAAEEGARELREEAQEDARRTREATQKALEQSARDMLLSLRQQIEQALNGLVNKEVKDALSSEQLGKILTDVMTKTVTKETEGEVALSEADTKSLQDSVLAKLQKSLKGDIKFQSSDDISGGFMISYDAGKSSYDFTDESLANYLSTFVNTQVATILKESVK